jgi:NADH-quinone oxidoreductase subunit M
MAGLTVVLGAVYMLRAFQVMMLGSASESMRQFAPLSRHEKTVLGLCVALVIVLGIYPDPILSLANPTVESLLQGLNR